jgi:hypothetical protein
MEFTEAASAQIFSIRLHPTKSAYLVILQVSQRFYRKITRTARTTRRKYFDYLVFNIVDDFVFKIVDSGLSRSGARRRALAQTMGNARGLDINSPRSAENHLKTCDFIDISNAKIPTTLGGSTTTSHLIVVVILQQQLDYLYIIDYGRTNRGAPDKS